MLLNKDDAPRGVAWGFADATGAVVIAPQFVYDGYSPAPTFHNGLALVQMAEGYAYVNPAGEIVWGPAQ